MHETDLTYFSRRLAQEMRLAAAADSPAAAAAHHSMACNYAEAVRELERPRRLSLVASNRSAGLRLAR